MQRAFINIVGLALVALAILWWILVIREAAAYMAGA
jgi:hypothetical protein